jgi:hypothetical protein
MLYDGRFENRPATRDYTIPADHNTGWRQTPVCWRTPQLRRLWFCHCSGTRADAGWPATAHHQGCVPAAAAFQAGSTRAPRSVLTGYWHFTVTKAVSAFGTSRLGGNVSAAAVEKIAGRRRLAPSSKSKANQRSSTPSRGRIHSSTIGRAINGRRFARPRSEHHASPGDPRRVRPENHRVRRESCYVHRRYPSVRCHRHKQQPEPPASAARRQLRQQERVRGSLSFPYRNDQTNTH